MIPSDKEIEAKADDLHGEDKRMGDSSRWYQFVGDCKWLRSELLKRSEQGFSEWLHWLSANTVFLQYEDGKLLYPEDWSAAWQAAQISQAATTERLREALTDYDKAYDMMWTYFQCSEQCSSNESWAKKCSCGADRKSLEIREMINAHRDLIQSIKQKRGVK